MTAKARSWHLVWVDTRRAGRVVQYVESAHRLQARARARVKLINTREDLFVNMVAWREEAASRPAGIKLTENDVCEIRRRRAQGDSALTLAEEFGVSRRAVQHIISRRTWGWLQ